jgi:outer membrane protein assembly complex protein YaeT
VGRILKAALLFLLILGLLAPATVAASGMIDSITVYGLYRMTEEAFLHAMGVRAGDPYDPKKLRMSFRKLWDLGLFEDIVIEADDGPDGGKIVVVKVRERPVLTAVTYDENPVLNRTQIEDRYKEKDMRLRLGKPLDRRAIADAEATIRDYLGEKGFLDATVKAEIRNVTDKTRAAHFTIVPGGKTRIRAIRFTGNRLFGDRALRRQLELTKPRKWYWPWSKKNLYHPLKWDQDAGNIREMYQNEGYLDVELRAPNIEVQEKIKEPKKKDIERREALLAEPDVQPEESVVEGDSKLSPEKARKKAKERAARLEKQAKKKKKREDRLRLKAEPKVKKWIVLNVPVNEGEQYTTGDITVTGNSVFTDNQLKAFLPLREGSVLRNNFLESGVESMTRLYEDRGHLYASVVRRVLRREGETVADIQITVEEDEPYYISSIEFRGNNKTHDRVLRREMLINEGDLFSRSKLDISKTKVNQLGYFELPEDAIIEPVEGEKQVKIIMDGEDKGRNEIQIGGGYSGVDGAFFSGVYSTRNFLGRGQVLSTSLTVGGRSNRYQISFQEPWFLNRPYTLGFSLFRRDIDFGASLQSSSKGGGIILGKQLTPFSALRLSYSYESVTSTSSTLALIDPNDPLALTQFSSTNKISSLTPIFSYNRVNNPYRPSAGSSFVLSFQVAGGPLGGDTNYLKPVARFTTYKRPFKRSFLAFHAEAGMVREWQGGSTGFNSTNVNGVPRRYVLLDENGSILDVLGDPRNVDIADLVRSGDGVPALVEVGGDRMFLFQTELVFPLGQQAELAVFTDIGDALFEDQSWGFDTARVSAGVEMRFHLPVFPVPLRLIYAWPIREGVRDRTSRFTFSIGRSF